MNSKIIHPDCFAFKGRRCNCLIELVCKDRACPFYKTTQQHKEDAQRAKEIVAEKLRLKNVSNDID